MPGSHSSFALTAPLSVFFARQVQKTPNQTNQTNQAARTIADDVVAGVDAHLLGLPPILVRVTLEIMFYLFLRAQNTKTP